MSGSNILEVRDIYDDHIRLQMSLILSTTQYLLICLCEKQILLRKDELNESYFFDAMHNCNVFTIIFFISMMIYFYSSAKIIVSSTYCTLFSKKTSFCLSLDLLMLKTSQRFYFFLNFYVFIFLKYLVS